MGRPEADYREPSCTAILPCNQARSARIFYLQWHHLGKRTLLDVLSAENEHYGNQVSEITNRFDGYQAILRQYASAGTLARWLRDGQ
jgi:outer membrane protein TolC